MYLIIEENLNSEPAERVFSESGPQREVAQLNVPTPAGPSAWCDVVGIDENGVFSPAHGVQVEDSGAGNAWLIYGGMWGIRFRPAEPQEDWALANPHQWGVPFKVLDISGEDVRFKK